MKRVLLPALLALALPRLTACGSDDSGSAEDGGTTTLTVYAAASLTSTFEQIAEEFEAAHDGVEVELSFGGSADLVTQIQRGRAGRRLRLGRHRQHGRAWSRRTSPRPSRRTSRPTSSRSPCRRATRPGSRPSRTSPKRACNLVVCAPEVPCGAAAQTGRGGRRGHASRR